ncbi:MAG: Gfo/Idh/MocA family oxidoreductase, partial [Verrucomicrobiota bacterium]
MNKPEADITEFNRRDFLRGGSVATLMAMMGGVPLIAQVAPEKAEEAKVPVTKIKVAVIGLGLWGREILDQLGRLPQVEIAAICDNYPAMVRRSAGKAPGAAQVEDYKAVLDNKDIQAVIIATPTHLHKDVAIAALQAGKHVYCEAPLAHTIEDAKAIAQAAKNAVGQVFQAGLQMRSDPQRHFLLPFIRSGALGKFVMARAQWHKKQSWRSASPNPEREKAVNWRLSQKTSSGLIGEIGIHQLDQAAWFLNALPVSVGGYSAILRGDNDGRDVPDTVQLIVEHASGVRLIYDATLANSFDSDYEIYYGTDAAVMLRDSKAWMFKEVDSPLLGWEVYARKDSFGKETGIALVADASKSAKEGAAGTEEAPPAVPLQFALEAFIAKLLADEAPAAGETTVKAVIKGKGKRRREVEKSVLTL